jgi:hypothetical protein
MKYETFRGDEMDHEYYAYLEHMAPTVAGFKTGDLRLFNYEK